MATNSRPRKSLVQELLETVLLTVILFGAAKFSLQTFMVQGQSMNPTLQDNEYILVDRISYRFHQDGLPSRGDIVVFKAPPVPSEDYIKRVIALPGDIVAVRPVAGPDHVPVNHIFVNGRMLSEPYIAAPPDGSSMVFNNVNCVSARGCQYTVPSKDVFVMGDNRNRSYDSRMWGPLPVANIVGRALISYWPLNRLSFIQSQFSYTTSRP